MFVNHTFQGNTVRPSVSVAFHVTMDAVPINLMFVSVRDSGDLLETAANTKDHVLTARLKEGPARKALTHASAIQDTWAHNAQSKNVTVANMDDVICPRLASHALVTMVGSTKAKSLDLIPRTDPVRWSGIVLCHVSMVPVRTIPTSAIVIHHMLVQSAIQSSVPSAVRRRLATAATRTKSSATQLGIMTAVSLNLASEVTL